MPDQSEATRTLFAALRPARLIEAVLRQFDNEDRELVIRFRLWKGRWFGYRVAALHGSTPDGEMILGEWERVQPTARLFGHTVTCSCWRTPGPWSRSCDCGSNNP